MYNVKQKLKAIKHCSKLYTSQFHCINKYQVQRGINVSNLYIRDYSYEMDLYKIHL